MGRKKCSQIVAIGEYFGRFGYLCNYSEEVEVYKNKSIVTRWNYDTYTFSVVLSGGVARVLKAEGKGFEPLVHCCTTVFKTAAFDRSAIPPVRRKGTLFSASSSYREARRPAPRCPRVASVSFTLPVNVLLEARLCRRLE